MPVRAFPLLRLYGFGSVKQLFEDILHIRRPGADGRCGESVIVDQPPQTVEDKCGLGLRVLSGDAQTVFDLSFPNPLPHEACIGADQLAHHLHQIVHPVG